MVELIVFDNWLDIVGVGVGWGNGKNLLVIFKFLFWVIVRNWFEEGEMYFGGKVVSWILDVILGYGWDI